MSFESNYIQSADVYWKLITDLIPLGFVGAIVSLIMHLQTILSKRTWLRRIVEGLCVVLVGFIAAIVAALGLTLFVTNSTPELQLLVAALAGAAGQKVFDIYWSRLFGKSLIVGDKITQTEAGRYIPPVEEKLTETPEEETKQ